MFEHVGRPQYPTYFRRVHDLLKPDGTALIHSIGRLSPPGTGNAWIRKYIFPGGYIPAASEARSEEHTSELQSLMRISYAVFCLKKKKKKYTIPTNRQQIQRRLYNTYKD